MSTNSSFDPRNELNFGKVFCPAPFIEYMLDVATPGRMCCRDKRSNLTHDEVRDRMLLGEKVPDCEFCYNQENNRTISFRQIKLKNAIKKHAESLENSVVQWSKNGTLPPRTVYQITSSNVCNYACIMCSPDRSSSLAKKMGFSSQIKQVDISDIEIPIGADVALAGGEPFLIKDYLDLLSRSPADISLTVSTNGSIVNDALILLLKKFKNLYLTISIDSIGEHYQKIRVNGDWVKVERNIEIFRLNLPNIFIETTIQKDNVNQLCTIYDWARKKNLSWKAHVLTGPSSLRWQNADYVDVDQLKRIDCQDVSTRNLLKTIIEEYSNNLNL